MDSLAKVYTINTTKAEITVTIYRGSKNFILRCWSAPHQMGSREAGHQWFEMRTARTIPEAVAIANELAETREGPVVDTYAHRSDAMPEHVLN